MRVVVLSEGQLAELLPLFVRRRRLTELPADRRRRTRAWWARAVSQLAADGLVHSPGHEPWWTLTDAGRARLAQVHDHATAA